MNHSKQKILGYKRHKE